MSDGTRGAVALAIVVIGWIGRADASEPEWRGSWLVDADEGLDGVAWRHVGAQGAGLVIEGRVRGFDVSLRGHGSGAGVVLDGTALDATGAERAARLVGRPIGGDAASLEVTFEVEGSSPAKEIWRRPGAPSVRLAVPGGRRGASAIRFDPAAPGGLRLEVHVAGRPQRVLVQVLAPDDPRYAHLGGVVHHDELGGGARLGVGRHAVEWNGRDRSLDAPPLLPGRYRVVVTAVDGPLGPAPGEERRPAGDELVIDDLVLVVGEDDAADAAPVAVAPGKSSAAPAPSAAIESPRPGLASGLASRP